MIFGQVPIILPAVLGRAVPFSRASSGPLLFLRLLLVLRVGGDLLGLADVREWGAMFNVIAVLLFLANTARAIRNAEARPSVYSAPPAIPVSLAGGKWKRLQL